MAVSGLSPQTVISEDFMIVHVHRKAGPAPVGQILPESDQIRIRLDRYGLEVLKWTPADRPHERTDHSPKSEPVDEPTHNKPANQLLMESHECPPGASYDNPSVRTVLGHHSVRRNLSLPR